jgi:hypothetical protein
MHVYKNRKKEKDTRKYLLSEELPFWLRKDRKRGEFTS